MNEFKGTPGPWLFRGKSESVHVPSDTHPYGKQIFRFHEGFEGDESPSDADLALILAAPDLLEALYGMLLHIREPESESEFQWPEHFKKQKDAFIAARAAVAKALSK